MSKPTQTNSLLKFIRLFRKPKWRIAAVVVLFFVGLRGIQFIFYLRNTPLGTSVEHKPTPSACSALSDLESNGALQKKGTNVYVDEYLFRSMTMDQKEGLVFLVDGCLDDYYRGIVYSAQTGKKLASIGLGGGLAMH